MIGGSNVAKNDWDWIKISKNINMEAGIMVLCPLTKICYRNQHIIPQMYIPV